MNRIRTSASIAFALLVSACATGSKVPPPEIRLDDAVLAQPLPEPAKPQTIVAVPQPLPLPAQLKPLIVEPPPVAAPTMDASDSRQRVTKANDEARVAPAADAYLNAIQVWPYAEGALYQVYASPGRVTDVMLQPGESLVSASAGDTVRWIVGDTTSASGSAQRVHLLLKPVRPNLKTNLIVTTNRRLYLLELTSTADTWMASVSWSYPHDQLAMLKREAAQADTAAPVAAGIALERLHFRYAISGDTPPWRPLRAFDDGEHVYIQFPVGIAQGELPPLFVVGVTGEAQLVNYRYRAPYYIVDRLFGAAELRLGSDKTQAVRISRNEVIVRGGS